MIDLNECDLPSLWRMLSANTAATTLRMALAEDRADHDITTKVLCDTHAVARARVVARRPAVCAGLGLVAEVLAGDPLLSGFIAQGVFDGASVAVNRTLGEITGPRDRILRIERSFLNLLGIAMATATVTAQYVAAVEGTKARVCDTRKTIPGLRWLQKYAVRCGGGHLHRLGLDDAVLIKDNHIAGLSTSAYAQSIHTAVKKIHATNTPLRFICAEADTPEQFEALLALPPETLTIVLLDNFSLESLADAVRLRDRSRSGLQLEASGGVRLDTIGSIARTGVDRISVGALTHSAGWLDVALDMDD